MVARLHDTCPRPAAAFRQQLDDELGRAGAKSSKVAIELRTDLDEFGPPAGGAAR